MKEIRIHLWCDACYRDNPESREEAADTVSINFGGPTKTLDLCKRHKEMIIDPISELLTRQGQKLPTSTSSKTEQRVIQREHWDCPLCSVQLLRSSAVSHLVETHMGGKRPPQPSKCPDCGFTSDRVSAMNGHRARVHGWSTLDEYLTILHQRAAKAAQRAAAKTKKENA